MFQGTNWRYELPEYLDPENDEVSLNVNSMQLSSYLEVNDRTLSLKGVEMPGDLYGNFTISVDISDDQNRPSRQTFTLWIRSMNEPSEEHIDEEEVD